MPYMLSQDYLWKEMGGQVVILHCDSGRYYSLNASGSLIWKGLLENQSAEEIMERLCGHFEVDRQTAQEDIQKMIRSFLDKNFIAKS